MKKTLQLFGYMLAGAAVLSCAKQQSQSAPEASQMKTTGPKRVLVVSVTAGFRHSAIPVGEEVLAALARKSGVFTVEFVRQPSLPQPREIGAGAGETAKRAVADALKTALEHLNPENLRHYDAVIFNNTTGDLPLPDKGAFLDWIAAGHGFVGIHAATDTFRGHKPLDPYVLMVGAEFDSHGPQVEVDVINQDPSHPACKHLPKTFRVFEEIYLFSGFDRSKVHGLLALNKHPNTKEPGDYPIAWCKRHGKGRVFYTSLGHREDIWDPHWQQGDRKNPPAVAEAFQRHLLGGILWALGLELGEPGLQSGKAGSP